MRPLRNRHLAGDGPQPLQAAGPASPRVLDRLPRRPLDIRPSFLLQRLAATAVAVLGSISLVFCLVFATGSPATLLAGAQASREDIAALNALYGFDRPIYEQYGSFLLHAMRGEFPHSLRFDIPAFEVLAPAIPLTLCWCRRPLVVGRRDRACGRLLAATASSRFCAKGLALLTVCNRRPFSSRHHAVLLFSLTLGWFPRGQRQPAPSRPSGSDAVALIAPPWRACSGHLRSSATRTMCAPPCQEISRTQGSFACRRQRVVPVLALLGTQAGSRWAAQCRRKRSSAGRGWAPSGWAPWHEGLSGHLAAVC